MGSPDDEPCRVEHETQRTVQISRAISMAATEVTQGQFQALMGYNPSFWRGCGQDCPVERVTWHEAAAYCNEMSRQHDRAACYRCTGGRGDATRCSEAVEPIVSCGGYRLPTEAEWEYAARAGVAQAFSRGPVRSCMTSDDTAGRVAWYKSNSTGMTHPVAQKLDNPWGLYDMHGNVSEWVGDWYDADLGAEDVTDPAGPLRGTEKVFRGGDWYHNASHARSAHRERIRPEKRLSYLGFRCVVMQ
jgi:formylglycine-generating enzyme required for sulfatase activity